MRSGYQYEDVRSPGLFVEWENLLPIALHTDNVPTISSAGNPAMYGLGGIRQEGNGFPAIFNIEADSREENNVVGTSAWVIGPYLKVIGEYLETLEKYPNPKPVRLTEFAK